MQCNKYLLGLIFTCFVFCAFGQQKTIWLTYGSSRFMHHPGLEIQFPFRSGIWATHAGVNTYIRVLPDVQLVNISDDHTFNFLSANLGISRRVWAKDRHEIGLIAGGIAYYAPLFRRLKEGVEPSQNVYFDASHYIVRFGFDYGAYYHFNPYSLLAKFDTRRGIFKIGLGYTLPQRKKND